MYKNYKKFLIEFDKKIKRLQIRQKDYIFCRKGCCLCCEKGEYPFSQIEFGYLTEGYLKLNSEIRNIVKKNIEILLVEKQKSKNKRFEHKCPFLINNECSVYEYRGIICRTFGLCYYDEKEGYVRLPECVKNGLNYSKYYNKETKELYIDDVPMENLRIDAVLNSNLAKEYGIVCEEIRPMLNWIS